MCVCVCVCVILHIHKNISHQNLQDGAMAHVQLPHISGGGEGGVQTLATRKVIPFEALCTSEY